MNAPNDQCSNSGTPGLILASASKRRQKILRALGAQFTVVVPEVDEVAWISNPVKNCNSNAILKHRWCRARYPGNWIISADTVVDFEGQVLHKPVDRNQATAFFRMLSGKTHRVLTAVAFSYPGADNPEISLAVAGVTFRTLTDLDIRSYFDRVHPLDKAGAYDIDQSSDLIIAAYSGSKSAIMGLPVEIVGPWLRRHGLGTEHAKQIYPSDTSVRY